MPKLNSNEWKDWITYARKDREEARSAYARSSWSEACFHAQQSCEKLLKAFLMRKGVFLPIHDLRKLAEENSNEIVEIVELEEALEELTVHYYAARYPDATTRLRVVYGEEVAKRCVEVMEKLWRVLEKHVQ